MSQLVLNAEQAYQLDQDLFQTSSLEILMEKAGRCVATSVQHYLQSSNQELKKIVIVCGPGNNGGDGLVAARYLYDSGYTNITVVSTKSKFIELIQQLTNRGISISSDILDIQAADIVIDCVFGFSFKYGAIREPWAQYIQQFRDKVVISVDIPSSYPVDLTIQNIQVEHQNFKPLFIPKVIISLSAPKPVAYYCQQQFSIKHYLAANIIPEQLKIKYNLQQLSSLWQEKQNFILLNQ